MQNVSVQRILAEHFDQFASECPLRADAYRAGWRMRDCRTAALGIHLLRCPCGHVREIAYNSCRHRCCQQCSSLSSARWLDAWKQRLLPCPHHHVVFTLPHELNLLWRYNKEAFSSLLFQACSQSLKELLADPQFLGAKPGILSALHTWSQQLAIHVHVHALVTAGGMSADGTWTEARKSCLLPRKVLMVKFRGKMRALLLQSIDDFQLPPGKAKTYWISQLNRLGRVCWNVKLLERYDHGRGVAHYLARYLRGGPISDTRLLRCNSGVVVFRYRQPARHGERARKGTMRLTSSEFLRRFLEHVPPHGYRMVRGYGVYSCNQHCGLAIAHRQLAGKVPELPPRKLTLEDFLEQLHDSEKLRCSLCGQRIEIINFSFVRRRPSPLGPDPPRHSPVSSAV